jgi:hypothetical protein
MRWKSLAIGCFLFFAASMLSHGQRISGSSTFRIEDDLEERIFAVDQLEFFEDTTNLLDFDDIIQDRFQDNFRIRPDFDKSRYNVNHTYWVKVSIENDPNSSRKWVIEFYDQSIDLLTGFLPERDGSYRKLEVGDARPFDARSFKHKNFEFVIANESAGISNYYFKIQSSHKADIRVAVRSVNRFVYYALSEYFAYGIFYGMIVIIALYNLLIYSAIREVKYLFYTFYLISVGIYAMCVDGIAFQYLWPDTPQLNQVANGIFSFSIMLWAILFSIKFLNTKNRSYTIHVILLVMLGLKTVLFLGGFVVGQKLFEIRFYDIIPFFFIFAASIHIWTKGYKVARFFVIAYGMLFIGVTIKALVNAAIIPHHTLLYYSLHIAFLLEMLLLTFALADRVKILKDNRDRAMQRTIRQMETNAELKEKVNRELEYKVKERTQELEEKNRLLEEYARKVSEKDEEIKRINSLLDKDNYKLKSSIRESFQARLSNKALTLEEFRKIFPDKSACLRHLEEVRWGKGFECRQCNNTKSSRGPKIFTKRCSRCGHIDSVTAGTIFHGVKFPLEKAFYLAYTVINNHEKQTLDQLAELLDLRKNTVWAFRKKVMQNLKEEDPSNRTWSDLLILHEFSLQ